MAPDLLWEFSGPLVFMWSNWMSFSQWSNWMSFSQWSNWMSFSQAVPACTGDSS